MHQPKTSQKKETTQQYYGSSGRFSLHKKCSATKDSRQKVFHPIWKLQFFVRVQKCITNTARFLLGKLSLTGNHRRFGTIQRLNFMDAHLDFLELTNLHPTFKDLKHPMQASIANLLPIWVVIPFVVEMFPFQIQITSNDYLWGGFFDRSLFSSRKKHEKKWRLEVFFKKSTTSSVIEGQRLFWSDETVSC